MWSKQQTTCTLLNNNKAAHAKAFVYMYWWPTHCMAVAAYPHFIKYSSPQQVCRKCRSGQPCGREGWAEIGRRENLAYLWQLSNVGQVRKMIMAKSSHAEQSPECVNQCGTRSLCLLMWDYKGGRYTEWACNQQILPACTFWSPADDFLEIEVHYMLKSYSYLLLSQSKRFITSDS